MPVTLGVTETAVQPAADALSACLAAVQQAYRAGNATEHTYRPAFKAMLEPVAGGAITETNEPCRSECGAPDFIATRGTVLLGYRVAGKRLKDRTAWLLGFNGIMH